MESFSRFQVHIAPMVDVTHRSFRHFMRLLSKKTVIWTEMIHMNAVVMSPDREKLLAPGCAKPVIFQLGGNDPDMMAKAAKIVETYEYDEVNINCGCPSDRATDGCFGA